VQHNAKQQQQQLQQGCWSEGTVVLKPWLLSKLEGQQCATAYHIAAGCRNLITRIVFFGSFVVRAGLCSSWPA
jgi:hypothetical protein